MKRAIIFFSFLVNFLNHLPAQTCNPDATKRVEVKNVNKPSNFICHIVVNRNWGNTYRATASFISSNVVIGAGHSFREKGLSKIKSIEIYVGQRFEDGNEKILVKKTYLRSQLIIWVDPNFQKNGNADYDYGYVALPENITSEYFQLKDINELEFDSAFISGYPSDKMKNSLWVKGDLKNNLQVSNSVLKYNMYTFHEDSGAPVWCLSGKVYCIIGVHGTGNYSNGCNAGVRLTEDRIKYIRKFIDDNSIR